ncbi:MAG: DNA recombination protein RmuC [Candidatus Firestonebacteria bacterium]
MNCLLVFIIGVVFGIIVVFIINLIRKKEETERIKESFGNLSLEALRKNSEEFLKLANEILSKQTQSGEKTLGVIKQDMEGNLQNVQNLMVSLEKDREQKFGEISTLVKSSTEQVSKLSDVTNQLNTALASSKIRGQWGERMAEDVLRLAGFMEGINYLKQKSLEKTNTRPDFTFLLPNGLKLNMDVKFPLDNYLHYFEAGGETEMQNYKSQFLRDVRSRIKEVTTRDYINPEENTIDYMIVFIPNEQVYAFINENDRTILDDALKNKVVLCSPLTLYAILAVIRQAIDNFKMEKTASQVLVLLNTVSKQWTNFIECFDDLGKKIENVQKEYNALISTRKNQVEKTLRQIEELKVQREDSNKDL